MGLKRRLKEYEKEGNYIRVGLIGAGQMGRGLISQVGKIAGMEVVITADVVPECAETAYRKAGALLLDFEDGGSGKGGKVDRFTGMGGYPGWENGGATGFGRCGGGRHRHPGGGGGDRLECHPEPASTSSCSTWKPMSPSARC